MMDDGSDKFSLAIQALIPKSLDDVIRWHREHFKLRLTTNEEIFDLYKKIEPDEPKDLMNNWNLITLNKPGENMMFLLGDTRSKGRPRITSDVTGIHFDRSFLTTKSGSLYQLGNPKNGPPTQEELYLVCATFHSWGFGAGLGVPHFFY